MLTKETVQVIEVKASLAALEMFFAHEHLFNRIYAFPFFGKAVCFVAGFLSAFVAKVVCAAKEGAKASKGEEFYLRIELPVLPRTQQRVAELYLRATGNQLPKEEE